MTVTRPVVMPLADGFGRVATDLRISLTDRCSLRCTYCMPAAGLPWLPREELLTDEEIVRLAGIAVRRLGVTDVRLTGGEPLLRPGLVEIVAALSDLGVQVSMTTNGIGLDRLAAPLRAAGLTRVNVSLDTLRPATFRALSHRDRLPDTLAGLAAATAAGLAPVKVNSVLLRGANDDEATELLAFCLERGYALRFIEQMPLDPMHHFDRSTLVTAQEILNRLAQRYVLTPDPTERGGAPAERWLVDGGPAVVGVVGSVTRPFCADCDRTRLTADGQVRSCLFAREETDLRGALRAGICDDEIAARWVAAMAGKKAGHGIDAPGFTQPDRPMSAIGG
jgi:cyclic pyranopterin phosphate synthase